MPSVAFHETAGDLKVIDTKSLVVAMITVVSFGGIHLLAWNLPVEGLLWKISAVMTIACAALYGSSHLPWLGKNPKAATKTERFVIKTIIGIGQFLLLLRSLVPDYRVHSVALLFATRCVHGYLDGRFSTPVLR